MRCQLPIPATHLGSLSQQCALFLLCHTANLSSTGNTVLSYYLWRLAFRDATQAGMPIELSCSPALRTASRAKHLHYCSHGRVLSSSRGSAGVIYSPFKQPLCIHCRLFRHIYLPTKSGTNHRPDTHVWDCLVPKDSRLVCVNLRIWLIRLSSTVAPQWQGQDMICCLSWLQTIRQSVHWDVTHRVFSQCLGWQIRLLAESHYFQKAH